MSALTEVDHCDMARAADTTREYHGDLAGAAFAFLQCLELNAGHLPASRGVG